MFEDFQKALCEAFSGICEQIQELEQLLKRLFGVASDCEMPILMPYHCRVCGRKYETPEEARRCTKRHFKCELHALIRDKAHMHYAGTRVVPRKREAMLRATEVRRQKREFGTK